MTSALMLAKCPIQMWEYAARWADDCRCLVQGVVKKVQGEEAEHRWREAWLPMFWEGIIRKEVPQLKAEGFRGSKKDFSNRNITGFFVGMSADGHRVAVGHWQDGRYRLTETRTWQPGTRPFFEAPDRIQELTFKSPHQRKEKVV